MTLKSSQIHAILQAKQEDFTRFDRRSLNALKQYRQALIDLPHLSPLELYQRQVVKGEGLAGASPLEGWAGANHGVLPCKFRWDSREESMKWVRHHLSGVSTFAVDGSQIFPSKDLSIPVALVQIGWFENPHDATGFYEKDIDLDVMTPSDLKASHSGEPVDRRVNFRRLQMEINRLVQYIEDRAESVAAGARCLVFFDGSFVATFAQSFEPQLCQDYIQCFLKLLRASQTHRVPLVGYVDTTYARDLTVMLQQVFDLPDISSIHDAQLVNPYMEWGDRTPILRSQQSGIVQAYEEQTDQLTFTYLKTTRDGYPARLEMPLWMVDDGIANQIIDWVRGEVIIGGGYPYVIETADQTAVLRSGDRQVFFRILQEWSEDLDLNLRLSKKMISKVRRR